MCYQKNSYIRSEKKNKAYKAVEKIELHIDKNKQPLDRNQTKPGEDI